MTFLIKIESLPKDLYKITAEDDNVVTSITTTSPQKEVLKLLSDAGIKGKRGPKGSRINPNAVPSV